MEELGLEHGPPEEIVLPNHRDRGKLVARAINPPMREWILMED